MWKRNVIVSSKDESAAELHTVPIFIRHLTHT